FGKVNEGKKMISKLNADFAKLKKVTRHPKVLFIYARGTGTMMVAGKGTSVKSIIELAGGENATNGFDNFKPLTPEALVVANPDYILLFNSGLESLGGMEGLLKVPGIAQTNAGKNRKVIEMEGEKLTGFGPRLGEAVLELNGLIQK
ncbi:MAG: ABC transporter substrate-binding protein, partial [Siphonobacter sp.]